MGNYLFVHPSTILTMPSVNKVILIGNLTRDPELRYTPKGSALCEIGMAVNRKYKLESGEQREEVTFLDISFWGKQAEVVAKWMKKGRPLYVEGRLQMDTWDDKTTGQKRSKIKIVAEDFQFLGGDRGGEEGGHDDEHPAPAPRQASAPQAPRQAAPAPEAPALDDDDVPF